MYATENRRIVFGDMAKPSPSPQQNDKLLALSPPDGAYPPSGLRPVALAL